MRQRGIHLHKLANFVAVSYRHEHIGEGTIGAEAVRRLLHDDRFAHAAFIAETPVDLSHQEISGPLCERTGAGRPTDAGRASLLTVPAPLGLMSLH